MNLASCFSLQNVPAEGGASLHHRADRPPPEAPADWNHPGGGPPCSGHAGPHRQAAWTQVGLYTLLCTTHVFLQPCLRLFLHDFHLNSDNFSRTPALTVAHQQLRHRVSTSAGSRLTGHGANSGAERPGARHQWEAFPAPVLTRCGGRECTWIRLHLRGQRGLPRRG